MSEDGEGRTVRKGFVVLGRVQGVGFRWWTRREAARLGLRGSVRNLPDGTVSVMAVGEDRAVNELRASLAAGPPLARVRSVEDVEYEGDPKPAKFTIDS